jgi:erythromycin esterase
MATKLLSIAPFLLVFSAFGCSAAEGPPSIPAPGPSPAAPPEEPAPEPHPDPAALPDGLTRLYSSDSDDYTDLAALDAILGDASLVGLGESVHTSGGYYGAKARLFRFLVEKKGFRVFSIESPRGHVDKLARFVDGCRSTPVGTPREALRGSVFGVFADDHLESLTKWMCDWNKAHASDPVSVFGFDVQQPEVDGPALLAFLDELAGPQAAALKGGVAQCAAVRAPESTDYPTKAQYEACEAGLAPVDAFIRANEASIVAQSSREHFEMFRLAYVGVRSWEYEMYFYDDWTKGSGARDEAMADVFETLKALRHPNAKIALWAHNYHLSAANTKTDPYPWAGPKTMGELIAEKEGARYAPIGLIGYDVKINWPGAGDAIEPPTEKDALEKRLHALGEPRLLVDTKLYPGQEKVQVGGEGARYVPMDQFRALVFLDHSEPMKALFW